MLYLILVFGNYNSHLQILSILIIRTVFLLLTHMSKEVVIMLNIFFVKLLCTLRQPNCQSMIGGIAITSA